MDFTGTSGDDDFIGTPDDDTFDLTQGGDDSADGGGGNDLFLMGAAFTRRDSLAGGSGNDEVVLEGNYAPLVFSVATMTGIERLRLTGAFDYDLISHNATVAPDARLIVDASDVTGSGGPLPNFRFDGSGEGNGRFKFVGSAGRDWIFGGARGDRFVLSLGGDDAAFGGARNDHFDMGAAFNFDDTVNGGDGNDTITLDGDYAGANALVCGEFTFLNIEEIVLTGGHSYDLTFADGNADANGGIVNAFLLGAGDSLILNLAAELDGGYSILGGAGNDVVRGTQAADIFEPRLGDDTVRGGGGADTVVMGGPDLLGAGDRFGGGAGFDTLLVAGVYSAQVHITAGMLAKVEKIVFADAHDYDVVIDDGVVAAGDTLTVTGLHFSGSVDSLTLDATAETDGAYAVTGSNNDDTISLGAGNDTIEGLGGDDTIDASGGGTDTAQGGAGSDSFFLGGGLSDFDAIDGGDGSDTVVLDGDYGGFTFDPTNMTNVETLVLVGGHSYSLGMGDGTVAAGGTLVVDASTVTLHFTFGGALETDGRFEITGGSHNDTIAGGAGDDAIDGGAGKDDIAGSLGADDLSGGTDNDIFRYHNVASSTGNVHDRIHDLDLDHDQFGLSGAQPLSIDPAVNGGTLDEGATFDAQLAAAIGAGQLAADRAVLFTPDGGTLAGRTFLVVDANDSAGYQAAADYVIDITGYTGMLESADFI